MRKIKVKVLDENKQVEREFITTPEDLFLEEGWTENDVDMALDGIREKMPFVFARNDGSIGDYDFGIIEEKENVEKKGKSDKSTELIVILDMSGSMSPYKSDTIGGFNALIEEQKKDSEKVNVTLVTFNDGYHKVLDREPLEKVDVLTDEKYQPGGMTALLDAIGKTVAEFKAGNGSKVMISITTDGLENASKEFKKDAIQKIIAQKEKEGWEFIFVGANMDAVSEAVNIGIREDRAMNFRQEDGGTRKLFKGLSKTLSAYKKDESMDAAWEAGKQEIE